VEPARAPVAGADELRQVAPLGGAGAVQRPLDRLDLRLEARGDVRRRPGAGHHGRVEDAARAGAVPAAAGALPRLPALRPLADAALALGRRPARLRAS